MCTHGCGESYSRYHPLATKSAEKATQSTAVFQRPSWRPCRTCYSPPSPFSTCITSHDIKPASNYVKSVFYNVMHGLHDLTSQYNDIGTTHRIVHHFPASPSCLGRSKSWENMTVDLGRFGMDKSQMRGLSGWMVFIRCSGPVQQSCLIVGIRQIVVFDWKPIMFLSTAVQLGRTRWWWWLKIETKSWILEFA